MTKIRLMMCVSLAAAAQVAFLRVGVAQTPPPAAPAPAPVAPGPPPPPAYDARPSAQLQQPMSAPIIAGPIVTLRTDNPRARLQQMQLRWRDICVSPCGLTVDPAGTYRIGGGTIRPSPEFRMPRPSGPVLIDTQTGSTVKHWIGFGMTIGGGVSALVGVLYLALAQDTNTNANLSGTGSKDFVTAMGITYLVTGVILLAIGIPLSTSSTSVQIR